MTTIEGAEVESVEEGARVEIELPSLDDDLARAHIRRGFEAIREGLPDQAKWEFEQARDLADDTDIVGMAQAQLSELSGTPEEIVQEHVRPIEGPIPASTSTPISVRIKTTDWSPVIRIGLIIGTLNGVLTGCGAILCLGFLLAPAAGFAAGWMTARKDSTADTAHKSGQSSDVIPAIIAGGITGLGGWLGEIIGHPIWVASTSSSRTDPLTTGLVVACMPGTLYVLMAIAASVFGWRTGTRKQHRSP